MAWEVIGPVGKDAWLWRSDVNTFAVSRNYLGIKCEPGCGEGNALRTRKAAVQAWQAQEAERREQEIAEFVASHEDDDSIDVDELERMFTLAYGRPSDADDRAAGLWSLICAAA